MEARSVLRRINPDLAKIDIAGLKKILKCTFIKAMRKICCLSVHFLVFSKNFEKKKNKKIKNSLLLSLSRKSLIFFDSFKYVYSIFLRSNIGTYLSTII